MTLLKHLGIAALAVAATVLFGEEFGATVLLAETPGLFSLASLRRKHEDITEKLKAETAAMQSGDGQYNLLALKSVLGKVVPEDASIEDRKKLLKEGFSVLNATTDELQLAESIATSQMDADRSQLVTARSMDEIDKAYLDRVQIPEAAVGKSPEDLIHEAMDRYKAAGWSFESSTTPGLTVELPVMPQEWDREAWRDKTLFTRSAGWLPERFRTGQVVPFAYEPVQLLEVIPQLQTIRTHADWMEQTTRRSRPTTDTTKLTAEGSAVAEATLVWTERSAEIRKITTSLPITSEALEDAPMVSALINMDLRNMLMEDTEALLFAGETNFDGFDTKTGTNTKDVTATSTDIVRVNAVSEMAATIRAVGKSVVSHVCMSPISWHRLSTIRGNDQYMFGSPATMIGKRIWGFPVITTTYLDETATKNNLIMGNFTQWAKLVVRRGVTVEIGTTGTQFVEMKRTILASHRCILQILRPAAFGKMKLYKA